MKALADALATRALEPLGWNWHTVFVMDRLAHRFVAYPQAAWEAFAATLPPWPRDDDAHLLTDLDRVREERERLTEPWLEAHGVAFDHEDYAEGMRLLRERALEKAGVNPFKER